MARNILVINCDIRETRVCLIEDGIIAELHVERSAHRGTVGNIVLGKVTRVLPGMQAAFIDLGMERAAFLHVEDLIRPDDFEAYLDKGNHRDEPHSGKGDGTRRFGGPASDLDDDEAVLTAEPALVAAVASEDGATPTSPPTVIARAGGVRSRSERASRRPPVGTEGGVVLGSDANPAPTTGGTDAPTLTLVEASDIEWEVGEAPVSPTIQDVAVEAPDAENAGSVNRVAEESSTPEALPAGSDDTDEDDADEDDTDEDDADEDDADEDDTDEGDTGEDDTDEGDTGEDDADEDDAGSSTLLHSPEAPGAVPVGDTTSVTPLTTTEDAEATVSSPEELPQAQSGSRSQRGRRGRRGRSSRDRNSREAVPAEQAPVATPAPEVASTTEADHAPQTPASSAAVEGEIPVPPTAQPVAGNRADGGRGRRRRRRRRRGQNGDVPSAAQAARPEPLPRPVSAAPAPKPASRDARRGRERDRGRNRESSRNQRPGSVANRVTRSVPITEIVKEGDQVVVQISKEPIGTKGARVTSHISLPGRHVVYLPTVDHVGISKRIGSVKERQRLRQVIEALKPETGGLIVRTVAEGLTKKDLKTDIGYLIALWKDVSRKRVGARAPAVLYSELDLILKTARDLFTDQVERIIVDDKEQYTRLVRFVETFFPGRAKNIELYSGDEPIFDAYGIEDEIGRALGRKVPLPSGGYLVIDQAEALTAIDVNTGRYVGKGSKDLEETALKTNLEAVSEIAYQLRLRNIGGLVILDLIDMDQASNRERVWRALEQRLAKDKAKTTINRISELGLIEMTRKRTRESLTRVLHEPCFYCDGTGQIQSRVTVAYEILRQIRRERHMLKGYSIVVNAHPAVIDLLQTDEKAAVVEAERRYMRRIELTPRREYHLEQFDLQGR